MSGIFGIICQDARKVEKSRLHRMSQAMRHRGPDGEAVWAHGSAGLGHRMLHTTPESLFECLPWKDPLSGLVITADARIDNRSELLRDLDLECRNDSDITDSQLILAAYRKWDRQCVQQLLGDFAFAIWDVGQRQLFCAWDHMGIKPFYYHQGTDFLVFASSTPPILSLDWVPKSINKSRVADYLVQELEGLGQTSTFHNEIYRLPPASWAIYTRKGLEIASYWNPEPGSESALHSDQEYLEAFDEVFTQAVQARMRSSTRSAISLSGGVDSASICGIARRESQLDHGADVATYSMTADDESQSLESRCIRELLDGGNIDAILLKPADVESYSTRLDSVLQMLEDPFDSDLLMSLALLIAAGDRGDRVILDGVDGDLGVSLPESYPAFLLRGGHWRSAFTEIQGQYRNYNPGGVPLWRLHARSIRAALAPDVLHRSRQEKNLESRYQRLLQQTPIAPSLAACVDLIDRIRQYDQQNRSKLGDGLGQSHRRRVLNPYLSVAIERYDRVASYVGVELRHPYLDKRLVEFCLALPWNQKVRHGWSKYILRSMAATLIPESIAWRGDHEHLGWAFSWQYLLQHRQRDLGFLARNMDRLEGLVDLGRFKATMVLFRNGSQDAGAEVWNVLQLGHWLMRYNEVH